MNPLAYQGFTLLWNDDELPYCKFDAIFQLSKYCQYLERSRMFKCLQNLLMKAIQQDVTAHAIPKFLFRL